MVNKPRYVIAIDIGTTSTKALVIDLQGKISASHAVGYPLHTPGPDRAEQNPEDIFQAVLTSIRTVIEQAGINNQDILCVSFSSAMHSLMAVDKHHSPLTPCLTFADNRSAAYAKQLRDNGLGHQIYRATGTPIHPMSPLLKLMWLRDNEPELFQSAYKFIGIKEYIFAKLYDQYIVDYSIASATGLFNLERLTWDETALDAIGLSAHRLSNPVSTTHQVIGLKAVYANEMRLDPQTPFIVGASDGVLANLGIGAIEQGVFAVTIGTSGAVRGVVDKPLTDPQGRLFCYALTENFWVIGGPINNGGIILRWVKEQLATKEVEEAVRLGSDPYDHLSDLAASINPGADGLICLPLLTGERAPHWNANARGMFFGLSLYHEKNHMIRAAMEGVMFRIHSVLKALEELAGPTTEIRASGGFARSELWSQILSDVSGVRLVVPDMIESSGIGAAKLGLLAMNVVEDFRELDHWLKDGKQYDMNEEHHDIYRELIAIYNRVYTQLEAEFDLITAFQLKHAK